MPSFYFCKLQLITVLLLICDSYMSWSIKFAYLKRCVKFSIFDFVSFLLKFILFFDKMHGLFDLKLLQEFVKFNDICVSWSSPKIGSSYKVLQQSHYQLQDALDIGSSTQTPFHKVRFDIEQSHHQLCNAINIGLATQALDQKLCFDI